MSDPITIAGLLLSIGLFGFAMTTSGGGGSKGGCIALVAGVALVVGCGVGLLA